MLRIYNFVSNRFARGANALLWATIIHLYFLSYTNVSAQTHAGKCSYIYSNEDFTNCRRSADAGDTGAMVALAQGYARGFTLFSFGPMLLGGGQTTQIPPDKRESLRYYKLAADHGDNEALRYLFEEYFFGRAVSKNEAIAKQYLQKAAQYGSEWAILLLAQDQEMSAPAKALETYLRLARNNNCIAQMRLSDAYASGILVKQNLTQAYFWLLLAKVDEWGRKADVNYDGRGRLSYEPGYKKQCGLAALSLLSTQIEVKKALPAKLMQTAQDAATNWTTGAVEKLLPAPQPPPPKAPAPGSDSSPKSTLPRPPIVAKEYDHPSPVRPSDGSSIQIAKWVPLSKDFHPPELPDKQSAEELFAKARSSVWLVMATMSGSEADAPSQVSQGSAVAITNSYLLTNYHVIAEQNIVLIKQGDKVFEAAVVAGDKQSDRSLLRAKGKLLGPVAGLRGFGKLRVGEQVYTIGSPSGLESTLGQGIVSGLRTVGEQNFIQTTAPISPGSSGGGLFDSAGNLIGITSFVLRDSQGLNFAIAADDYFR
jgi:S1-C subfamily serine protease